MGTSTSRELYKLPAGGGRRHRGGPASRRHVTGVPAGSQSLASSATATTRSRTTIMSSKKYRQHHVRDRILLERKVWFLGRFYMQGFTETSMNRFRSHVRTNKGRKTKLRLSPEGLGSGYKTGSIFRARMPAEFIPLRNIYDLFADQILTNVLLCSQKVSENAYEVLAYRFQEPLEATRFQSAYQDLTGKLGLDHTDATHDHVTYNGDSTGNLEPITFVGSGNGANWSLKSSTLDRRPLVSDDSYGNGTLRSARSNATLTHRHQNGAPGHPLHLDDAINRRVYHSGEYNQWSASRDTPGGYGTLNRPDYEDSDTGTMKREIEQLTEEVKSLKTRLHSQGVLSDEEEEDMGTLTRSRTPIVLRAQPEMARSKSSDVLATKTFSDSSSDSGVTSRGDADLVDQGVGVVKARAGDHRSQSVAGRYGNQTEPETFVMRARSPSGRPFDETASSILVPVTRAGHQRGPTREEITHRRNMGYDTDTVDRGRRRLSNSSSPPLHRPTSRASRAAEPRQPRTLTRSKSTESKYRAKMSRPVDLQSEKEGSIYTVQFGPGGTSRRPRAVQKLFVPGSGPEYYMSPGVGRYMTLSSARSVMEPL